MARSLLSYHKVQKLISSLIRGSSLFINGKKIRTSTLLNIGCGVWPDPVFINLDWHWMPGVDICWDLTRGSLPLKDATIDGVYSEHCLDCIPHEHFKRQLPEILRVLKPGGIFRLVLPDGELYLDLYHQRKTDKSVVFPYGEKESTGMISVNRYAREHTHRFSYDFETLELLLRQAGFRSIERKAFKQGELPRLLIDRPERAVESLYVEARK